MFGFFKKKFVADKDMTVAVTFAGKRIERDTDVPADALVRVETEGLRKRKLPELEVLGVPIGLVRSGAGLVNLVADYCANERPIKNGESFGTTMSGCLVAARGFMAGEFLRLVDLNEKGPDAPGPAIALSTLALLRGLSLVEEQPQAALAGWLASVAFFGGVPSRAPTRTEKGAILNDQNFLTYLALAQYDEEKYQAQHYRSALMRSADLWRAEFGLTELPELEAHWAIKALLGDLLDREPGAPWGPERMRSEGLKGADLMSMAPAPIIQPSSGGFTQSISVIPFPFRAYFYESPVREALRSTAGVELASALYAAARAEPDRVLSLTLETRNVYLPAIGPAWLLGSEDDAAPQRAISLTDAAIPVLSRLLADVGRRFAAGLTVAEVRAVYGLDPDAALRESAESKMEKLRDQEGRLMGLAVGLDLEAPQEA